MLAVSISQISTTLCPDLRYQDHLIYHYVGGIIFAALKQYADSAEFFELCASAPVAPPVGGNSVARGPSQGPLGISMGGIGMGMGMSMGMMMAPPGPGSRYFNFTSSDPSIFQVEAAKKLLLVHLILHGKVRTHCVDEKIRVTIRRTHIGIAMSKIHAPDGLEFEGYRVPCISQSVSKPRASPHHSD